MKLNKPTLITQADETINGVLTGFEKTEDGALFTLFVPKRKPNVIFPPRKDPAPVAVEPDPLVVTLPFRKLDLKLVEAEEPEAEGDDDDAFDLDLTSVPLEEGQPYSEEEASNDVAAEVRLAQLLEPYSGATVDKAYKLIKQGKVEQAKTEGQMTWFNVAGSTLYVVKITRGEDFLFAECSCPNGVHRGGEAICYHSIAARVAEAGLAGLWLN